MLSAQDIADITAGVAEAKARADEADELAPGLVSKLWSSAIGADSAASAVAANAANTRNLYNTLAAKAEKMLASPELYDAAAVADFRGSVQATDNTAAREAAANLKPTAAAEALATGLAPGHLPWWVWAIAALSILALLAPYAALASAARARR